MFFVKPLRSMTGQPITEIYSEFKGRIAVYEAEISRLKKENYRQRKLLDAVCKPEVRIYKSDLQQLLVSEDEVPSVKQERSPNPDREEPEPPHIKKKEEECWSSQEEEQLQGLEEKTDITKLSFPPVAVRSDNDEEKAQASQSHQSQNEEKREAEPPVSTSTELEMEPEPVAEDCGPSERASNLDQDGDVQPTSDGYFSSDCCESETEDSDGGWNKTREPQSGLDTIEMNEIGNQRSAENKPFSCSLCGKGFTRRGTMQTHMRIHTAIKPFSCSVCSKGFSQKQDMQRHMRRHTGEKPFLCPVCGKAFSERGNLQRHMRIHTGTKPFSCSVCGNGFSRKQDMQRHMRMHTGEKPFSCTVCGKAFAERGNIQTHMRIHTGTKPFSCSVCGNGFSRKQDMQRHMRRHT